MMACHHLVEGCSSLSQTWEGGRRNCQMLEHCRMASCLVGDYSRNFEMQGDCRKVCFLAEGNCRMNYQMLEDCRMAYCLVEGDCSRNFEMQGDCKKLYYLVEEGYSRNYQIL